MMMSALRAARIMLGLASRKCGSWLGFTRVVTETLSLPISLARPPIHGSVATALRPAKAGLANSNSKHKVSNIFRILVLLKGMRWVSADGEDELDQRFVVHSCVSGRVVAGELGPDHAEFGRDEFQTAGCPPRLAAEWLLCPAHFEGVFEQLEPV